MTMRKDRKTGYTTGVYAAAAAKAAALALFRDQRPREVTVELPRGGKARIPVLGLVTRKRASCCKVRKEGVEKGDVTAGALLVATVIRTDSPGIRVEGRRGVGLVTRSGLEVPVGERAINPVPRHMISSAVREVMDEGEVKGGCRVIISVPDGRKLATSTLNGRLGIEGGISILGTTGTQVPYSTRAFLDAVAISLKVARHSGNVAVLCTGRRSEIAAMRYLRLPEESFILCGDHVGWTVRRCEKLGFREIILWSMPAKMVKLAGGRRNLNWRRGLPDIAFLSGIVGEAKGNLNAERVSVHGYLEAMQPGERRRVLSLLCLLAAARCKGYAGGDLRVMTAVVNRQGFLEAAWPPWPWSATAPALAEPVSVNPRKHAAGRNQMG
jgi:cobalt-precorrin-5B (C1)-methyltransferase